MGFLKALGYLGGKIVDGVKEWNEEAQGYYQKGLELYERDLMSELERAQRLKNFSKIAGYKKAAKERGLI